jgi:hypothetical protein
MQERHVICDIDGTVALMRDEIPGRRGPFDWHRVKEDDPNEPIIGLLWVLCTQGFGVIFVSGRMEAARQGTLEWLDHYVIGLGEVSDYPLFMRADGDFRKDTIVKEEIYHREIEGKYTIGYVLDDRDSVVAMWRSLGLTVLQVAAGAF